MPVDLILPLMLLMSGVLWALGLTRRSKRTWRVVLVTQGFLGVCVWLVYLLPGVIVERKANMGDPAAQYRLSQYYSTRLGGLWRDTGEARRWMIRSAEAGYPAAMLSVGAAYSSYGNWLEVEPDSSKANAWLRKTANTGDQDAKRLLDELRGSETMPAARSH